jgi:hypothetical protein
LQAMSANRGPDFHCRVSPVRSPPHQLPRDSNQNGVDIRVNMRISGMQAEMLPIHGPKVIIGTTALLPSTSRLDRSKAAFLRREKPPR